MRPRRLGPPLAARAPAQIVARLWLDVVVEVIQVIQVIQGAADGAALLLLLDSG